MNNQASQQPGPLAKLLGVVMGVILLVVGVMFSVLVFAVVLVAGLMLWAYLWWKTRALRKAMRERAPAGVVIDGEAVVVDEVVPPVRETLPHGRPPP